MTGLTGQPGKSKCPVSWFGERPFPKKNEVEELAKWFGGYKHFPSKPDYLGSDFPRSHIKVEKGTNSINVSSNFHTLDVACTPS